MSKAISIFCKLSHLAGNDLCFMIFGICDLICMGGDANRFMYIQYDFEHTIHILISKLKVYRVAFNFTCTLDLVLTGDCPHFLASLEVQYFLLFLYI